jgi:tRNA(His) 5'-end guanylyltransferase
MTTSLDQFLKTLESTLPEILSDKDLVSSIPQIFKSASSLSRLRTSKESPPHFYISSACIRYLKKDILDWLRSRYQKATFNNEASDESSF